jgi:DNA polymerase-3 subunit alpha (Gram-positive type)
MNRKRTKQPVSNTEEEVLTTLENALEMTARGYKFGKLDINKSDASKFIIDEEKNEIIPPFVTIDGLGLNVAKSIIEARNERGFLSIEDVMNRTQINNTQRDKLIELGAFGNLNEENQLSLF